MPINRGGVRLRRLFNPDFAPPRGSNDTIDRFAACGRDIQIAVGTLLFALWARLISNRGLRNFGLRRPGSEG